MLRQAAPLAVPERVTGRCPFRVVLLWLQGAFGDLNGVGNALSHDEELHVEDVCHVCLSGQTLDADRLRTMRECVGPKLERNLKTNINDFPFTSYWVSDSNMPSATIVQKCSNASGAIV